MIDISQILNGGAAGAAASTARQANTPPSADAKPFGDALNRARQASGNAEGKSASKATDKTTDKAQRPDQQSSASRPAQAADDAQANAKAAEQAGEANVADTATDAADRDDQDETQTADGATAAAALLAGLLPAAQVGSGTAANTQAQGGVGLPGMTGPLAGAAGANGGATAAATTDAATQADGDATPSLAEQTLDTIASQRAALAATATNAAAGTASSAAAERAAALHADAGQPDAAKPAGTADAAAKTAVGMNALAGSQKDAGAQGNGADSQGAHAARHADGASVAQSAGTAPSTTMQAALAAAMSQSGADNAPIEGTADPLPQALAPQGALAAQAGSGNAATAATPVPVAPRLGDADWPQALSQQMIRLTTQGSHTAELQLNPPDLGPLKVVLNVSNDQAQAHFVSPHASVRAAVEAALPQLRHAMADSGIQLGQTSVGAEQFAGQQGNGNPQQQAGQRGQAFADATGRFAEPAPAATTVAAPRQRVGSGEVDTFA